MQGTHNKTMQSLSNAHAMSPTLQWTVWAILLGILLAGTLIYLLTQRQKETPTLGEQVKIAPTVIRRDRHIDVFKLDPTDDPIRLAYQKRLKVWHTEGYTIGRGETVTRIMVTPSHGEEIKRRPPPDASL